MEGILRDVVFIVIPSFLLYKYMYIDILFLEMWVLEFEI